jgi:hypothetical protein
MNGAISIAWATIRGSMPDGAPLCVKEIRCAKFTGSGSKNEILAECVMFDGLPATMHLRRWKFGWVLGWQNMLGGDCSFERGVWARVAAESGAA